jgi:hypothetical protein
VARLRRRALARAAEVGHLGAAARVQQHVARLDIAVQHWRPEAVEVHESPRDVDGHLQSLLPRNGRRRRRRAFLRRGNDCLAREALIQRPAWAELQHEAPVRPVGGEREQPDQVRVCDRAKQPDLHAELSRARARVARRRADALSRQSRGVLATATSVAAVTVVRVSLQPLDADAEPVQPRLEHHAAPAAAQPVALAEPAGGLIQIGVGKLPHDRRSGAAALRSASSLAAACRACCFQTAAPPLRAVALRGGVQRRAGLRVVGGLL